eukprot:GHVP01010110.1.p1 GENE.GHVP01010110.1~~GHVP01010110.1.p1  ORF type:complete len:176 (+),score=17.37 GHVP01010110.1:57-584(+)
MTLIFEAGLFKHSEELNTAFLQPLGRTPDNDDELKQNFSATEISFQIASTIKILSNNVVKTFKRCTESCSESSNEDSMSTSQEELLPKLVPCDRSKRIGEKWTTSSEVLQLLKTVPKSCVKTLKRCTEAGESSVCRKFIVTIITTRIPGHVNLNLAIVRNERKKDGKCHRKSERF